MEGGSVEYNRVEYYSVLDVVICCSLLCVLYMIAVG